MRKTRQTNNRKSLDTADVVRDVVTYQKQIKQFTSSEGKSAVPGQPMSFMDTFLKRNGQWKVVATVGVSQSPIPDQLYKAMEKESAQW